MLVIAIIKKIIPKIIVNGDKAVFVLLFPSSIITRYTINNTVNIMGERVVLFDIIIQK